MRGNRIKWTTGANADYIAPLIENGKVAAAAKVKEQIAKLEEQARLMGIA